MINGRSSGDGATDGVMDTRFIVEIILNRTEKEGLGFNIRGGYDMPHIPEDSGIFVTKIRDEGAAAADGRLSEGDKILEINGQSLANLSHRTAVTMFKRAGNTVKLLVLQDAERRIVEATQKRVIPKSSASSNKEVIIIGLGALLLCGFVVYKFRDDIKTLFTRLLPSKPDRMHYSRPMAYPPYGSRY